ncbi:MAG TPA: GNAT family N-acetyltransferase [Bacteroidales bacterium]|jgi:RimJ/RimL family protein N-acetyltransferase|nr:GNAT family N-acetyltransferase [Bacteroidales bacterium]MDI9574287.1 GNAT family N-acetyltransferase [Bacteroidota bacterium]OQC59137.1 MAG: hypothetical protein BWX51_01706 [Bacteroidetes bacterium ADurb.Bin012]MBP9512314.1 GNAT family N-acetyltransferase [Bacteroidales bacterium]MBP9588823.1 GNAT family N-acetyltransferase [Bacteroidales bacterium]
MKLVKYDIVLERLKEADIELVRQHRNSEQIRRTMEYREYITPEMQREWFESVNKNIDQLYFIIHYRSEKIGLINAKNIDWEKQILESGIFLWESKYYETFLPAIVSIMITDMCFQLLGWDVIYAHILRTNDKAIKYNKSLGYVLCEDQEDKENQLYRLRPESFHRKTQKLRKAISNLYSEKDEAYLIIEPSDIANDILSQLEPFFQLVRRQRGDFESYFNADGSITFTF